MKIYYDTEFLDDGRLVRLISIGMVREDGKTYYAVNSDLMLMITAAQHPWLKEHVLSSLPVFYKKDAANIKSSSIPIWDHYHPDFKYVKPKDVIALDVAEFIRAVYDPSLWAWFAAYDHLVLSQLYGRMIDIPPGIPQRTNDLAQEAERLNLSLPHMPGVKSHNALEDAREVKWRMEWLEDQRK